MGPCDPGRCAPIVTAKPAGRLGSSAACRCACRHPRSPARPPVAFDRHRSPGTDRGVLRRAPTAMRRCTQRLAAQPTSDADISRIGHRLSPRVPPNIGRAPARSSTWRPRLLPGRQSADQASRRLEYRHIVGGWLRGRLAEIVVGNADQQVNPCVNLVQGHDQRWRVGGVVNFDEWNHQPSSGRLHASVWISTYRSSSPRRQICPAVIVRRHVRAAVGRTAQADAIKRAVAAESSTPVMRTSRKPVDVEGEESPCAGRSTTAR